MDQISAFVNQQKEWLEAELHSSRQERAANGNNNGAEEGRSRVLTGLEIAQVSVGLYGRTVIEVGVAATTGKSEKARLPAHRFTTGDEVELRASGGQGSTNKVRTTQGVVSLVTDACLAFAISGTTRDKKKKNNNRKNQDEDEDDQEQPYGEPPFTLVPSSSVEVHRKMVSALSTLAQQGAEHPQAGSVVRALFDPSSQQRSTTAPPIYAESLASFRARLCNPNLDDSQVEAIQFALQPHRVVSLIHGPPGTGKTTTLQELIRQAVKQHHWRVLVTAPSNVAVDNILARLVASNDSTPTSKKDRLRVVRLGHPARLQANILPYSLEALVQVADGTEIVQDVRKELANYLKLLSHFKYETRATARREVRQLRQEVRQREEGVVQSILQNAQVVLATTVGAATKILTASPAFDLVVIDEAAQALEASCWIPILRGRRLVLAGDHCQLPPTIQSSQPAVMQGLGCTLFERLMHLYGDHLANTNKGETGSLAARSSQGTVSRMLRVQYRMNEKIANWASKALYGGQLQTHASCALQTLTDFLTLDTNDDETEDLRTPLLLIDTAGCGLHEQVNAAGSRLNEGEAQLIQHHVNKLILRGMTAPQIAVITPYNGQVETLRNLLLPHYPQLEIRSVDGFQGGERAVVVLSLVRSSPRGGMDGIGFLKDDRRLNVAVTRAQRHCCVVADSETVSQSPFVKVLLDWIEEHGDTRSALEYLRETDTSEAQVCSDLMAAELELSRLIREDASAKTVDKKPSKPVARESSEAHKQLAKMVKGFAEAKVGGAELRLSAELSSFDRKMVHELAEKFGIEHKSEGTEGVDRRIVLSIPKGTDAGVAAPAQRDDPTKDVPTLNQEDAIQADAAEEAPSRSEPSRFDVLDDTTDEEAEKEASEPTPKQSTDERTTMNSLLGNLAQERAEREQTRHKGATATISSKSYPTKSLPKAQQKKGKGRKLGGARAKPADQDDGMDDLDDMSFLDAQINKVQNSHGRKVDGKGGYKSIVNGILIAKPQEREAPKNTRASAALQSKLKEAQDGRKAKPKKKKR